MLKFSVKIKLTKEKLSQLHPPLQGYNNVEFILREGVTMTESFKGKRPLRLDQADKYKAFSP